MQSLPCRTTLATYAKGQEFSMVSPELPELKGDVEAAAHGLPDHLMSNTISGQQGVRAIAPPHRAMGSLPQVPWERSHVAIGVRGFVGLFPNPYGSVILQMPLSSPRTSSCTKPPFSTASGALMVSPEPGTALHPPQVPLVLVFT